MSPTNESTANERRLQLAATAETRALCIAQVGDYLARTGLHREDFARRIGYSPSTFHMFMADTYHAISGNPEHIMKAARTHMAAHPVAPQAQMHGDLFETANVRMLRETFESLLPRPKGFMVYAPPGSQKSFVLEHLVCELNLREMPSGRTGNRAVYVYCGQGSTPLSMMKRIAQACGTQAAGNRDRILNNLQYDHAGRRTLIVLDEAQHLSPDCLDVVRELLDRPPYFSLLFAGSHGLLLTLDRMAATMEQVNSRIVDRLRLPGCTQAEAEGIVEREVGAILDARGLSGAKRERKVASLIADATVVDAYVPTKTGEPKARYINIRTLCNALDDVKMQVAKAQRPPVAEMPQDRIHQEQDRIHQETAA